MFVIFREDMVSSSKKLPCGHIFHTACLRSWFQRQQTCPTCRLNILRTPVTSPQPQNQPQNNNQNVNQNNNGGINIPNAGVANNNPFMNLLSQNAMPNQASPVPPTGVSAPPMSPFFFPTLPFMAPYTIPPPPMPQNLDQLSIEELRAMEGHERKNVEERIKLLKNVQTMLNASVALMNQYQLVVANLPPLPIPQTAPVTVSTPSTSTTAAETPITSTNLTSTTSEASTSSQSKTNDVKIEDIGMDLSSDLPSTSKNISSPTATASTSTFLANESIADGAGETTVLSEEANEIRKRRLQKFLQNN